MNAIPARVAGVTRLAMVVPTPEGILNPAILTAAKFAGITEIYRIGGAQAIAALAFGTASIAPVAKIVGPGNAFVAEAKRQVFGTVGIDMIAGPSEICVVADNQNNPDWIAADILSQAEHDSDAQAILIVEDAEFAKRVVASLEAILPTLPRQAIARQSWQENGAVIVVGSLTPSMRHTRADGYPDQKETVDSRLRGNDIISIIDRIAPEHLELAIEFSESFASQLHCAGAIFLGRYSPEAFGDYVAGASHVLPTNGTARFSSGLSVTDFLVRQSVMGATAAGFQQAGRAAHLLAEAEGLHAHALSLRYRLS
jgi:histidinol dehydrogenase